ncbi:MAG: bestrophin family protein, partial [Chitinophagales bacterium]
TGVHIIWLTCWAILVTGLYELTHWKWMSMPLAPLTIIGTAVAFYVGFKNNQAYDRLWEARKIWGAIVNSSRAWGTTIKAYLSVYFTDGDVDKKIIPSLQKQLIYRHIAWLYALRSQLLIPTEWEHISQTGHIANTTKKRMKTFGVGLLDCDNTPLMLKKYLSEKEYETLINFKNTATQIIDKQAQDLKTLREQKVIEDFRHMELQKILNDFYVHQGKCERIKKFPLPRQYGSMSLIFIGIFILLLPFGFISQFHDMAHYGIWLNVPFTVLVGWVYVMMELVGDYSENPFEGLGNDIPMLALCRTIEIDLLEMLGEEDIPEGIKAKNGVLM